MVFGGIDEEQLQLNEDTLWAGGPHDYSNPRGAAALPQIRQLVFASQWTQAQDLINQTMLGNPAGSDGWAALIWSLGLLVLFFPIALFMYRKRTTD